MQRWGILDRWGVCTGEKCSVLCTIALSFLFQHFSIHTHFHPSHAFAFNMHRISVPFCFQFTVGFSWSRGEWLPQQKNKTTFHHSVFQNKVLRWRQKAYVIQKTCLVFSNSLFSGNKDRIKIRNTGMPQFQCCLRSSCYLLLLVATNPWFTQ